MGSGTCDGVREGTGRARRIQASLALGAFSALPRGRGRGTKAVVGAPWAGGWNVAARWGRAPSDRTAGHRGADPRLLVSAASASCPS